MSAHGDDLVQSLKLLQDRVDRLEEKVVVTRELEKAMDGLGVRSRHMQDQIHSLESSFLELFGQRAHRSTKQSKSSDGRIAIEMADMREKTRVRSPLDSYTIPSSRASSFTQDVQIGSMWSMLPEHVGLKAEKTAIPQSPYTAIVLFGVHESRRGSYTILLAIALIFILQVVLCVSFHLMNTMKVGAGVSALDARRWRTGSAHQSIYRDNSGFSMVTRVCNNDFSLALSTSQRDTVRDINNYLESSLVCPFGIALGSVVATYWSLKAMSKLLAFVDYFRGLLFVPHGRTQIVVDDSSEDETLHIESISLYARASSLLCCAIAITIYMIAWILGCIYIVRTLDVEDVVLNGLGVLIILDVDDLVFDVFIARSVKEKIVRLGFVGYRGSAWSKILLMVVVPVFIIGLEGSSLLKELREYLEETCGGDVDFVVIQTPFTSMLVYAPTTQYSSEFVTPDDSEPDPTLTKHFSIAVYNLTQGSTPDNALRQPSFRNLYMYANNLDHIRTNIEARCRDLSLTQLPPAYLNNLRWQLGAANIRHCGEVKAFSQHSCYLKSSVLLRNLCPISCGCDRSEKGLFYRTGCPDPCHSRRASNDKVSHLLHSEPFKQATQNKGSSCQNFPPGLLLSTPEWSSYVVALAHYWNQSMSFYRIFTAANTRHIPDLHLGKCPEAPSRHSQALRPADSIKSEVTLLFCRFPSFAFWCPESCWCDTECQKVPFSDTCLEDCNLNCRVAEI